MLSKDLEVTLNLAFKEARSKRHEWMTVEHLLLALLDNSVAVDVLKAVGADIDRLRKELHEFIESTTPLIPAGDSERETQPTPGLSTRAATRGVPCSVFRSQGGDRRKRSGRDLQRTGKPGGLLPEAAERRPHRHRQLHRARHIQSRRRRGRSASRPGAGRGCSGRRRGRQPSALESFATNLNEQARKGRIDPLVGREAELERVIQVLCRRRKNNPLLVGESGVGKTAIAEGLAKRIVDKQVPDVVADGTVYALDLGALLAGTKYRGDFEKRFKMLLADLKKKPNAILFIDEIHTIIGAGAASGGVMDASNLLKPMLTSGELRCMGSTTYQEYRGIFEKDRALSRRFQKIDVTEPNVDDTYQILKGLKSRFEDHYHIRYTDKALRAAAELSERYITDRFLPDKAIDVIDEAGAAQKLLPPSRRKKTIGATDVEQVVAKIARIPSAQVTSSDKEALRDLDKKLKMVVFGQDEAIDLLAASIKLSRAGFKSGEKPTGSFLFAGPTGVGKTEVCRQLAIIMGVELLRFDMSEYMERHTVSRLIGAPPGYIGFDQGGLLTEAVTKHPHSVVLLDEVEKAHPEVFNLLLQVMDHGTLTDNNGRKADFRNVVLIMTTNAGAQEASRASIGFTQQDHASDAMEVIRRMFTPEFRNRLDAIVQFKPLDGEIIKTVVDKFLTELQAQLDEKRVQLEVDDEAREWLAREGYDEKMGARPMQRLIQEKIKRQLAEDILFGDLSGAGGTVYVSVVDGDLSLRIESAKATTARET